MPLPYKQNKKHIYKWVENNKEYSRHLDRMKKRRKLYWKNIQKTFFNILLD